MIRLLGINDTNMIKLSEIQQKIIKILFKKGELQSSVIYGEIVKNGSNVSLVTIKRTLSSMAKGGLLVSLGSGRSVHYGIATAGKVFFDVNPREYCGIEPDKRYGASEYNFDLFSHFPDDVFTGEELKTFENGTKDIMRE